MNKALNILKYVSGALVLLISAYKWPVYFILGLTGTIYLVIKYLDHDITKAVRKSPAFGIFERLVMGFLIRTAPWLFLIWLSISLGVNFGLGKILKPQTVLNFEEAIFGVKLIFFALVVWQLIEAKKLFVNVPANHNNVYQGFFTGWRYPNPRGFNWVSPFSSPRFDVETDRHLEVTLEGNAPVAHGADTMPYKTRILFRVGSSNEDVIKFTETTESNIKAALLLRTGDSVANWLWNVSSPDYAKTHRDECFSPYTFEEECGRYGLEVEQYGFEDLDYSKEVADAKKATSQITAFNSAVNEVLTGNPGMNREEAIKIVKALLLGGNYKQIDVTGQGNVMVNT